MKYNTAGTVVSKTDPLSHTVKLVYEDLFNSTGNPTTYAYPTKVYDPAGNYSIVKYRYDIGTNVEATSPVPAGQMYGKTSKRLFDSVGRLERDSILCEYNRGGIHMVRISDQRYPAEESQTDSQRRWGQQYITDARGAVTNFTYNSRALRNNPGPICRK
jgi:hypothetical protein